jgi:hypothetical protein
VLELEEGVAEALPGFPNSEEVVEGGKGEVEAGAGLAKENGVAFESALPKPANPVNRGVAAGA